MNSKEAMTAYWNACEARGDRPEPIYAVIWRGNSVATATDIGEVATWSLNRREMNHYARACGLELCRVARITLV